MVITSLKISNLPLQIDPTTLEDMFSLVGNVESAKVVCDENGSGLGIAVVEMATAEQAQDCILHFNGKTIEGKTIFVRQNKPHVPDPTRKTLTDLVSKQKGNK